MPLSFRDVESGVSTTRLDQLNNNKCPVHTVARDISLRRALYGQARNTLA